MSIIRNLTPPSHPLSLCFSSFALPQGLRGASGIPRGTPSSAQRHTQHLSLPTTPLAGSASNSGQAFAATPPTLQQLQQQERMEKLERDLELATDRAKEAVALKLRVQQQLDESSARIRALEGGCWLGASGMRWRSVHGDVLVSDLYLLGYNYACLLPILARCWHRCLLAADLAVAKGAASQAEARASAQASRADGLSSQLRTAQVGVGLGVACSGQRRRVWALYCKQD